MPDPHWQYFLALESRFIQTLQYVELAKANYRTYSIEFASILLSASSEVDVLAKVVCRTINSSLAAKNIVAYRKCICTRYSKFHEVEPCIPAYGLSLRPWDAWASGKNPEWWWSYNQVKHHRDASYSEATLENAMNAMAGLFCMALYYLRTRPIDSHIYDPPRLFDYDGIMRPGLRPSQLTIVLPDA